MIMFENLKKGGQQFFAKFTNQRGTKFVYFPYESGSKISYSSERGVPNLCHVILNYTNPLLLGYK